MPAADGGALQPIGPAGRFERELADTSHAVQRLSGPALATITPVLVQAQRETADALRRWLASSKGDARFTPVMHRAVLAHLERALHTVATLDPTLRDALGRMGIDAGRLAVGDAAREFDRFSTLFDREPTRLPVNAIRILATGERALIPRFRTSAARYANGVADDIRRELAVGLAKRETVHEMVNRLVRHGGPRGLVALRGVAGEPGAQSEQIAEGLFARYRYWAERVVRTETQGAYNTQIDETLREAAPEIPGLMRRWDASADLRICDVCAGLHGAVAPIGGAFPGGYESAPAHPNCRCRVGAWRASWNRFLEGRRPRTPTAPPPPMPPRRPGTLPPPPPPAPPPPSPPKAPAAPATPASAPGAPPASFASTAEAERWASARWPGVDWDLRRLDTGLVAELLAEFHRLDAEWPEVTARLKYFGSYTRVKQPGGRRWGPRVMAHASVDGARIAFNPKYWGTRAAAEGAVQSSEAVGFHPVGSGSTAASVLTHEWGHQVDHWLRTSHHLVEPTTVPGDRPPGVAVLLASFRAHNAARADLSRYALTNTAEAFAEAFTSLRFTPPAQQSQYTQRLGVLLQRARAAQPLTAYRAWSSLSPAEQVAARARRDALYRDLGIPIPP